MDAEPLRFRRQGRSYRALIVFAAIWAVLISAFVILDAALWIVAFIGAFTLPALWELVSNPLAGLDMDGQEIRWFSGRRSAEMPFSVGKHLLPLNTLPSLFSPSENGVPIYQKEKTLARLVHYDPCKLTGSKQVV